MREAPRGVALVTGAGRGIGRAIAEGLAADGRRVASLTAALVAHIADGLLDALSGRHLHVRSDDWQMLPARAAEIAEHDLLTLRLRRVADRAARG